MVYRKFLLSQCLQNVSNPIDYNIRIRTLTNLLYTRMYTWRIYFMKIAVHIVMVDNTTRCAEQLRFPFHETDNICIHYTSQKACTRIRDTI